MSHRAWFYIGVVLGVGILLTVLPLSSPLPLAAQWEAFVTLTVLATLTQLFKANVPNRKLYYATFVFVFAGLLLLHPFLFAMLVIVSYSIEWAKERLTNSPDLRNWYLQPFNIAMVIISGASARLVLTVLAPNIFAEMGISSVAAVLLAAFAYVGTNQVLLALALVLARGMSWKEVASVDVENVQADLIHTLLGYIVAVVWSMNPWLILPALAPLLLTYRALKVPQLRKDAATDSKTGLWNAGHFTKLFTTEMERAKRFSHPLAIIMSDLDLLRNINNTYGHLAGDVVLASVGQIIRSVTREYDIAARFGGEEFAIAMPETELTEAIAIAERLRQMVEATGFEVRTSEAPIHATMSFGVACFPGDAAMPNDLIHQADIAVYQAKLKGRNCVVAASDLPRSLKLESLPTADRLVAAFDEIYTSTAGGAAGRVKPSDESKDSTGEHHQRVQRKSRQADVLLPLFVGGVISAGAIAGLIGLLQRTPSDLTSVGILCFLAVLAELYEVRLYGDSTFSVSVAIAFAAILIAGIVGLLAVSLGIVLAHYLRNREIAWYKPAFNWAAHVLAGLVPLIVFRSLQIPLSLNNFVPLTIITAITACAYYLVETGLVSGAMGLSGGASILNVWREQFQWTALFYIALSLMGLFMGIIYSDVHMGVFGLLVFAIPMAMIHYAQKQYVERTQNSVHELHRLNEELSLANREVLNASRAIRQLNDDLFVTVSKMIDARDPYVLGHAAKVADYATAIAKELNFPPERLEQLRQAALLHDIGKIGIPEQILNKPSKLTGLEYEKIKAHATLGADLLETSQGLRHLATFVGHHHEWWDGNGYPDGLSGEQIPLEARILAVCDAVESMASDRPYQRAKGLKEIIAEIKDKSGTQFDPEVARVCERILKERGESLVVNSAKQVALKSSTNRGSEGYGTWHLFPLKPRSSFAPVAD